MKRSSIVWIIIAACLTGVGILIAIAALALNHWDLAAFGNETYVTDTVVINEGFNDITLTSDTEDIYFMPSADGKCSVVFVEKESKIREAYVEANTLHIETKDTGKWYEHISLFSVGSASITVYLPEKEYAVLSVDGSTGLIDLPANFSFEDINLSVSTGDIRCAATASGMINTAASTGHITLTGLSADSINIAVSTGHVNVSSVTCSRDMNISVSTGDTSLSDVTCLNFSSDGSTGGIILGNVTAENLITVERSTGDIRFEESDAGELLIKTDTGDVTGTLRSDKVFIAQSDTGDINVPETTNGGKCKITTDTGDIAIEIR